MHLIRPEDDRFHPGSTDPFWNESAWFSFAVPERRLHGAVYFYHRPNMNFSVGGAFLWDHTARDTYDCVFYDWGTPHATPASAEMFDFELPNGLRCECIEPLQRFRLRYGADSASWYLSKGCRLDLEFEGFLEPHQSMMPTGQEEWCGDRSVEPIAEDRLVHGHYRQPGRMRGTVELNGDTIEIDDFSMRDHSWGPRRLRENPRGTWCWAIGSDQSYFQVMSTAGVDPEDDPILGSVDEVLCGAYLKDGRQGDVNSGKVSVVGREADGTPREYRLDCVDSLGRELHATGVSRNVLKFTGYPFVMMWWPQVEWTFDGQTAYGEGQDWWPVQQARRFLRSEAV